MEEIVTGWHERELETPVRVRCVGARVRVSVDGYVSRGERLFGFIGNHTVDAAEVINRRRGGRGLDGGGGRGRFDGRGGCGRLDGGGGRGRPDTCGGRLAGAKDFTGFATWKEQAGKRTQEEQPACETERDDPHLKILHGERARKTSPPPSRGNL